MTYTSTALFLRRLPSDPLFGLQPFSVGCRVSVRPVWVDVITIAAATTASTALRLPPLDRGKPQAVPSLAEALI